MSESTLKLITKILAGLFVFMGIIFILTGLSALLSGGIVGLGSNMASQLGTTIYFPFLYSFGGGLLALAYGAFMVALANGLWRMQKWVTMGLYVFAVLNFVTSFGFSGQSFTSMLFSIFVAWVGYTLSQNQKLLTK